MFYIFAQNMVEYLEKSDFNSRTCLLVSKLFNYSFNMVEFFQSKIAKNIWIKK
jgi:hypothetical protein